MERNENTDIALERFVNHLKRHGLKMTRERRLILREIFSSDEHFEAEDLLMRFRTRREKVSRATIYRTFDLLNRAGLIKKSDFGENHYHYERSTGEDHHDHMICRRCGKVIEFSHPELEKLKEKICREQGFEMSSHSLQIFGYCKSCRAKSRQETH
jgi:Fur family ferric uptake transcriptional regulator